MKLVIIPTIAIISGLIFTSAYARPQYNSDQLKQFNESNKCSSCDLSGMFFELEDGNHSNAVLDNANLSGSKYILFPGINFSSANLENANLSGTYFPNANFSMASLSGAHFDGATITDSNFYGATGFDPKNAEICGSTLPDGSKTPPCA